MPLRDNRTNIFKYHSATKSIHSSTILHSDGQSVANQQHDSLSRFSEEMSLNLEAIPQVTEVALRGQSLQTGENPAVND